MKSESLTSVPVDKGCTFQTYPFQVFSNFTTSSIVVRRSLQRNENQGGTVFCSTIRRKDTVNCREEDVDVWRKALCGEGEGEEGVAAAT